MRWVAGALIALVVVGSWFVVRQGWLLGPPPAPAGRSNATAPVPAPAPAGPAGTSDGAASATRLEQALSATATLYRKRNGEDVALTAGDRIAPSDALYLELKSGEPAYVYVLSADDHGETYVLFPAPGLDLRNPLAGPASHRLPGPRAGKAYDWQVTSAGGTETVMVIASRAPVPELERKLGRLDAARPDRPVASADGAAPAGDPVRGIGGMTASDLPAQDAGSRRLQGLIAGALPTGVNAPWVWSIRLANRER